MKVRIRRLRSLLQAIKCRHVIIICALFLCYLGLVFAVRYRCKISLPSLTSKIDVFNCKKVTDDNTLPMELSNDLESLKRKYIPAKFRNLEKVDTWSLSKKDAKNTANMAKESDSTVVDGESRHVTSAAISALDRKKEQLAIRTDVRSETVLRSQSFTESVIIKKTQGTMSSLAEKHVKDANKMKISVSGSHARQGYHLVTIPPSTRPNERKLAKELDKHNTEPSLVSHSSKGDHITETTAATRPDVMQIRPSERSSSETVDYAAMSTRSKSKQMKPTEAYNIKKVNYKAKSTVSNLKHTRPSVGSNFEKVEQVAKSTRSSRTQMRPSEGTNSEKVEQIVKSTRSHAMETRSREGHNSEKVDHAAMSTGYHTTVTRPSDGSSSKTVVELATSTKRMTKPSRLPEIKHKDALSTSKSTSVITSVSQNKERLKPTLNETVTTVSTFKSEKDNKIAEDDNKSKKALSGSTEVVSKVETTDNTLSKEGQGNISGNQHLTQILSSERTTTVLKPTSKEEGTGAILNATSNEPICKIPKLDPFDPTIMKLIGNLDKSTKCPKSKHQFGRIHDGKLQIVGKNIREASVYFPRRSTGQYPDFYLENPEASTILLVDYKNDSYGEDINMTVSMLNDGAHLQVTTNDGVTDEFFLHAVKMEKQTTKDLEQFSNDLERFPNVVVVVLESQSAANVERSMPETMKLLRAHPTTTLLKGHTINGDGTTAQVCAMLTGKQEHELPEARRGKFGAKEVDRWPFIFKNYTHHGYVTTFSEDDPYFGTFNYRLFGFNKPPTDHYPAPFWRHADSKSEYKRGIDSCLMQNFTHTYSLNYINSLYELYPRIPKFVMSISAKLTHGNPQYMALADKDFAAWFQGLEKNHHLNNTVLIITGDHGPRIGNFRATLQGKLEERLPFVSITVPEWWKTARPDVLRNLKSNSKGLTTHFDIHSTLEDILFPTESKKKPERGQSLFRKIDHHIRNCKEAGIDEHWCPCLNYKNQNTKSPFIQLFAKAAVDYINNITRSVNDAKNLCSPLKLETVLHAAKKMPNSKVQRFLGTVRSEDCDSCDVKLASEAESSSNYALYELAFRVSPSGGTYEVTIKVGNGKISVDHNISRTNKYGDQPWCVQKKYPGLRKFCFCKTQKS